MKIKFYSIMFNSLIYIFISPIIIGAAMAFGDGLYNSIAVIIMFAVYLLLYFVYRAVKTRIKNTIIIDIASFLILGPLGVSSTYYLQSGEINTAVVYSGVALGLFAVGLFSLIKENTLIPSKYIFCILCAPLIPILIYGFTQDHIKTLITAILIPFTIPAIIKIVHTNDNEQSIPKIICITNKILIVYVTIFSAGWIL